MNNDRESEKEDLFARTDAFGHQIAVEEKWR